MWMYQSLYTMFAVSTLSLLVLVWLATGRNPVLTVYRAIGWLAREPRVHAGLLGILAVLVLNGIETRVEQRLTNPWDYTPQVAQVGSSLLLWLQQLEWPPVTHALTFVYIILFPLFGVGSMLVYGARRDWDSLKRLLVGFGANYLAALPFYLLVPVNEAWAGGVGVRFLIPDVYPAFEAQYRGLSGLDNCFPSLHTSLALTYALVAWRTGYRRLAIILSAGAGLVMLSTLYLGVHWLLDLFAGTALALLASGYVPGLLSNRARRHILEYHTGNGVGR